MAQQTIYGFDKDGKISPTLNDPLNFIKPNFKDEKSDQPGTGVASAENMLSIEVPAGSVFMIWNIFAAYYSSASLAGRLNIIKSTTAAIGGVDEILIPIMFDPVKEAGPLGVAESKHLKGEKSPLAIVDNRSGLVSIYLNIEIPQFVGLALIANAATQEYSVSINGVKYL